MRRLRQTPVLRLKEALKCAGRNYVDDVDDADDGGEQNVDQDPKNRVPVKPFDRLNSTRFFAADVLDNASAAAWLREMMKNRLKPTPSLERGTQWGREDVASVAELDLVFDDEETIIDVGDRTADVYRGAGHRGGVGVGGVGGELPMIGDVVRDVPWRALKFVLLALDAVLLLFRFKIGRASCRERVCQ